MRATLTIRADEKLRTALRKRAALQGKSMSELAREILSEAVAERPLADRAGHLRGQLEIPSEFITEPWRKHLKERNWRP